MSFGFSAGDFMTAGLLIKDIIRSLKDSGGALSEYQELDRELHGLQRALDVIEHLQCLPEQAPMVNGLKVAALNCQFVLDNFATKLKKYEASLDVGRSRGRLVDGATKLKWSLMIKTDVQELRAYLSAHTSSLNMRLTIAGLSTSTAQNKSLQDSQSRIEHNLESAQVTLNSVNDRLGTQGSLLKGTSWMLWRLVNKITGDVVPQLKAILFIANRAWTSNIEILDRLVKMQTTSPDIDLRLTWAQSPVKFEDALGRVMPIPSEYNWEKVEAVIMAQFSTGPGHEKVFAGEYELYDSISGTTLSRDEYTDSPFFPGMTITMAIIIGQYAELERCPRPDCRSLEFVAAPMGSRAW
ncbi:hypothetical protein MMC29_000645 [Sticta canariensis]|nr:hypothetical protein [Sticta canariensis]